MLGMMCSRKSVSRLSDTTETFDIQANFLGIIHLWKKSKGYHSENTNEQWTAVTTPDRTFTSCTDAAAPDLVVDNVLEGGALMTDVQEESGPEAEPMKKDWRAGRPDSAGVLRRNVGFLGCGLQERHRLSV